MAKTKGNNARIEPSIPCDIPNAATVAALEELERGEGETFSGTTDQLFDELKKPYQSPKRFSKPN